jgi:hypothetical protein
MAVRGSGDQAVGVADSEECGPPWPCPWVAAGEGVGDAVAAGVGEVVGLGPALGEGPAVRADAGVLPDRPGAVAPRVPADAPGVPGLALPPVSGWLPPGLALDGAWGAAH